MSFASCLHEQASHHTGMLTNSQNRLTPRRKSLLKKKPFPICSGRNHGLTCSSPRTWGNHWLEGLARSIVVSFFGFHISFGFMVLLGTGKEQAFPYFAMEVDVHMTLLRNAFDHRGWSTTRFLLAAPFVFELLTVTSICRANQYCVGKKSHVF
jgi:hypothetical protein